MIKKNVVKSISAKDKKDYIMKENNWTESQYNKQRYIFKNKLRAYQEINKVPLAKRTQGPVAIMYNEAKARARARSAKTTYRESFEMRKIKATTAYGNIKKVKSVIAKQATIGPKKSKSGSAMRSRLGGIVYGAFKGLIEKNPGAQKIYDALKDEPLSLEAALSDYANRLHIFLAPKAGELFREVKTPMGTTDQELEFDLTPYEAPTF